MSAVSACALCVGAVVLPFALSTDAHGASVAPFSAAVTDQDSRTAASGRTQSLPLAPLAADRALGSRKAQGLTQRHVQPFALLGVVWDDPDAELDGRVQVRTRAVGASTWSAWRDVAAHGREHAPDPATAEHSARRVRGGTAPLWVGRSDGVEVRVMPAEGGSGGGQGASAGRSPAVRGSGDGDGGGGRTGRAGGVATSTGTDRAGPEAVGAVADTRERASRTTDRTPATRPRRPEDGHTATLPHGLHLELVDPGDLPATGDAVTPDAASVPDAAAAANAHLAPAGATVIPARDRDGVRDGVRDGIRESAQGGSRGSAPDGKPYIGARPEIVTRRGWDADEGLRERGFVYTGQVRAAFVHHTDSGNDYSCDEAASIVRGIYRFHVVSMGWRDIGYNFLIDKCGTIYEGRAGGVDRPVKGAHTMGFNNDSTGIAVIGTFTDAAPPNAAVHALAGLTAWKLGLSGADPQGQTYLTSEGGNLFPKGQEARLNVVSGHRDGYATDCPGTRLYDKLGSVRDTAARLQGR